MLSHPHLQQARLADPGRAGDEEARAVACVYVGLNVGEQIVSAEQLIRSFIFSAVHDVVSSSFHRYRLGQRRADGLLGGETAGW